MQKPSPKTEARNIHPWAMGGVAQVAEQARMDASIRAVLEMAKKAKKANTPAQA